MAKKQAKKQVKKPARKPAKKPNKTSVDKSPRKSSRTSAKRSVRRGAAPRKGTQPSRNGGASPDFTIHLVTTSTGDLLYRLASIAATQFSGVEFSLVSHRLQSDVEKLQRALTSIDDRKSIVIHAVADLDAKQLVRSECVERRIPHFDATGPLMDFLADCVGALPDNDVARLHRVDARYQRRIEAMEFTIQHDDGLGLETLADADVVIVGLSRVSKSPTSIYLGSRGFKTANVSITPETGFPRELTPERNRIVALTMRPQRLQQIRGARMATFGPRDTSYERLPDIVREVMNAESEFRKRRYPIIDVTELTIEQTAAKVLDALKLS